jgi:hypothetical protein
VALLPWFITEAARYLESCDNVTKTISLIFLGPRYVICDFFLSEKFNTAKREPTTKIAS